MQQRLERMNELLKMDLSRYLLSEIELPANCLVTISRVQTSPDLKSAKVYFTVWPENLRGTILEKLNKNNRRFYDLLKAELNTKIVPNVRFLVDEQEIFANEVDRLLDEVN